MNDSGSIELGDISLWGEQMVGVGNVIYALPDSGVVGDIKKAAEDLLSSASYMRGIDPEGSRFTLNLKAIFQGLNCIVNAGRRASKGDTLQEKFFVGQLASELTNKLGEADAAAILPQFRKQPVFNGFNAIMEEQLSFLIEASKGAYERYFLGKNWADLREKAKQVALENSA